MYQIKSETAIDIFDVVNFQGYEGSLLKVTSKNGRVTMILNIFHNCGVGVRVRVVGAFVKLEKAGKVKPYFPAAALTAANPTD